jgi:V8-like Glu-specific endopeptidase
MRHRSGTAFMILGLIFLLAASAVPATAEPPIHTRLSPRGSVEWTQEMYLQVVPRPMPSGRLVPDRTADETSELLAAPSSAGRAGRRPLLDVGRGLSRQMVEPATLLRRMQRQTAAFSRVATPLEATPLNRGQVELDFSSSRLLPADARLVYPYMAVGKLVFEDDGSFFACSASVISARLVLTAGHCVHDGKGSFFTSFQFAPAFHEGEAPLGIWTVSDVLTTKEWSKGGGEVFNAADFGLLVIEDQDGMRIGDVTGWLGWKTNKLVPNHITMVGFPGNHDDGQRMHQVSSGSSQCCFTNNAIFGSDMGPGASGAPWVQNFGDRASGQTGGKNRRMNRIVGVTSGGPGKEDGSFLKSAKWLSSAIPGQSFIDMINEACDLASGNCSRKGRPTDT